MQQSVQNQAQNVFTFLLLILTAFLAYRLFSSDQTSQRTVEPYKKQARSTKIVNKEAPNVEQKVLEAYEVSKIKKDVEETLKNNRTSLTSTELLPKTKDGWNDCNNYVPEYVVDFKRDRPNFILEEPNRNQDRQLGRTIYTIKKTADVSPWNVSTIGQQSQGFDENTTGKVDDGIVVVTATP